MKSARPSSVVTPGQENNPELRLYVVYTDLEATKSALGAATFLARDLKARLVLLVPKVVPYPLPLEAPPVHGEFTDRLLSQLLAQRTDDIAVRVYLCRDSEIAITQALEHRSLVVIGGHRRWWPNRASSLARRLKREGHEVILACSRRAQSAPLPAVLHESSR